MKRLYDNKPLWFWALAFALGLAAHLWADHIEVKNGTSWLEGKGDSSGNLIVVGAAAQGASGSTVNPVLIGALDSGSNLQPQGYTRPTNVALLASATHTTDQTTSVQTNAGHRGALLYLNVTAASGAGGLTLAILSKDAATGTVDTYGSPYVGYFNSAPKTATGFYKFCIYATTALNAQSGTFLAAPLPATYQFVVHHGNTDNYTYSLSMDLLP